MVHTYSRVSLESLVVHDATEKFGFSSKENLLFRIQSQSKFAESNEELFKCYHVHLESLGVD